MSERTFQVLTITGETVGGTADASDLRNFGSDLRLHETATLRSKWKTLVFVSKNVVCLSYD